MFHYFIAGVFTTFIMHLSVTFLALSTQVLGFIPRIPYSFQTRTGHHLSAAISLDVDFERKDSYSSSERPENDLMIRAALGEDIEKTPVWLFRQAGRHLPEYHAYKEEVGRGFLEMLSFPEDVAECTMQPIRRYEMDAAILFSDILVIAQALQIKVIMPGGVGIQVPEPLLEPTEVEQRIPKTSEMTPEYVDTHLGYVMRSITLIREKMAKEGKSIPLIGFSAAPWTLLFYMVGGSSKKNTEYGMKWLKEHPTESTRLLETLTKLVVEYMSAQVEAGVHMLQLFEAMGMMIDEPEFEDFCIPCLTVIAKELKSRFPDVPLMVFARGASFSNEKLSTLGYDVITIDGSVDRNTARSIVGNKVSLQGNYDPAELIESNGKTAESVQSSAKQMLEELGPERLIANLGEGLGGKESPELVEAFVNAIHAESEKIITDKTVASAEA